MAHTSSSPAVSRRAFAAGAAAGVAGSLVLSHAALADSGAASGEAAGTSMVPGTYTGTAAGASGDVSVSVTVDEASILDIEVGENNETAYLMRAATEAVPARILEAQSLDVDTVTGATFASRAIVEAVASCLEQAGADMDAWRAERPREQADEARDVDVVVVGSGLAGIMCAQRLKELGVESVLLIEKQGMLGGSSVYSAGQMYGAIEDEKLDYAREVYLERTLTFPMSEEAEGYPAPEKVDLLIDGGHETFRYLQGLGYELAYTDFSGADTPADTRVVLSNPEAEAAGITSVGETLFWTLLQRYEGFGGESLVETTATGLLVDESGAVHGVTAATPTGTLTVEARCVVMCTGSAGRGQDVLARWCPKLADGEVRVLTMGSDGSGIRMMADDAGAAVSRDWVPATAGIFSVAPLTQLTNASRNINVAGDNELFVDGEGRRLCAEFTRGSNSYYYSKEGVEDCVYAVFDSALAETLRDPSAPETGLAEFPDRFFKADTVEELAALAGLPADALAETVDAYNGYCAAGVDEAFGKDPEKLVPVETAPFWCVRYSITGKDVAGGVETDVSGRVLDADGGAIPGLYACGFAGNRSFYGTELVGSVGLQTCMTGGRVAAEAIAAELT